MMRHNVGDTVYVTHFVVRIGGKADREIPVTFFLPWEDEVVSKTIEQLSVKEHHKVPNYWDSVGAVKENDGYVLNGPDGSVWYNQYPKASYGQLDDSADRLYLRCSDEKVPTLVRSTSFVHYMENVLRGIKSLEAGDVDKSKLLSQHFDEMKAMFEAQTGKTLTHRVHRYKNAHGEAELEGWYDVLIS